MKPNKNKPSLTERDQDKIKSQDDHGRTNWRLVGMRLAAIFLVIVFLASECAALLPGQ